MRNVTGSSAIRATIDTARTPAPTLPPKRWAAEKTRARTTSTTSDQGPMTGSVGGSGLYGSHPCRVPPSVAAQRRHGIQGGSPSGGHEARDKGNGQKHADRRSEDCRICAADMIESRADDAGRRQAESDPPNHSKPDRKSVV